MNTAAPTLRPAQAIQSIEKTENFLLKDDLKGMTGPEKVTFYKNLCAYLGVDPISKPFGLYEFQNKEVLYIKASCMDQLAAKNKVSRRISKQEMILTDGRIARQDFTVLGDGKDELYLVKVEASIGSGVDTVVAEDLSTVPVWLNVKVYVNGKFDNRYETKRDPNALMKAVTKAYRRASLKLIALGANLILEDDIEEKGQAREIDLNSGESVGGITQDKLAIRFPKTYVGVETLRALERRDGNEGVENLVKMLNDSKKSPAGLSSQWFSILEAAEAYLVTQEK